MSKQNEFKSRAVFLLYALAPSGMTAADANKSYRGLDWGTLQKEKRPAYGNPRREAETAQKED